MTSNRLIVVLGSVLAILIGVLVWVGWIALAQLRTLNASEPTPAATVTVTPAPDEWQRFRNDPKSAFIFASAYEIIWGSPIGDGETADTMVKLASSLCRSIEDGVQTWDSMRVDLGADDSADKAILTAKIYCPELVD